MSLYSEMAFSVICAQAKIEVDGKQTLVFFLHEASFMPRNFNEFCFPFYKNYLRNNTEDREGYLN